MSEIIAAVISVLGTACCGGVSFWVRSLHRKRSRGDTKPKKSYLSHRIHTLSSSLPIQVEIDPNRSKLLQFIQYTVLIDTVIGVFDNWIVRVSDDVFGAMVAGTASKYVVQEQIDIISETIASSQAHKIEGLPKVCVHLIESMMRMFAVQINCLHELVQFERSDHCRDWVLLLADFLHMATLQSLSVWRTSSLQLNGNLNGVLWNGSPMSYVWHGTTTSLLRRCSDLESFLVTHNIYQSNQTVVVTDARSKILYISDHLERLTEYTASDVLGHNCRIFQIGLDETEQREQEASNSYIRKHVSQKACFYSSLQQVTKNSRQRYCTTIHAMPVDVVDPTTEPGTEPGSTTVFYGYQFTRRGAARDEDDRGLATTADGTIQMDHAGLGAPLHVHTLLAATTTCMLQRDCTVIVCSYVPRKSMVVDGVFNNGSRVDSPNFSTNICMSQQIEITMMSIDRTISHLCQNHHSSPLDSSELVHYAQLQYMHGKHHMVCDCWLISNEKCIMAHRRLT